MTAFTISLFFSAVIVILLLITVLNRLNDQIDAAELKPDAPRAKKAAYEAIISPGLLITFFCVLTGNALVFYLCWRLWGGIHYDLSRFGIIFGGFLVNVIPLLFIYFSLLLPFQKTLKRKLHPAACAALWILPNILCVFLGFINLFLRETAPGRFPVQVILLKGTWPFYVLAVWLAGVILTGGAGIVSHLYFRRKLLRRSALWEDPAAQRRWKDLQEEYLDGARNYCGLYRSSALSSPLSIGLSRRSVRVILPGKAYTEEELDLILRHELLHLIHQDPAAKLFISFIRALFWFAPHIRIGCRSLSDDLERSCDRLVLGDAPEETRRQYAALLLRNAGESRGYTTCLSASAGSLKKRMEEVLHPVKRRSGIFLIALLMLVLILPFGRLAVACGGGTVKDELLGGLSLDPSACESVWSSQSREYSSVYFAPHVCSRYSCRDPEALARAVDALPVYPVAGLLAPSDGPVLVIRLPGKLDDYLEIGRNSVIIHQKGIYYLEESDWEDLYALFEELKEIIP